MSETMLLIGIDIYPSLDDAEAEATIRTFIFMLAAALAGAVYSWLALVLFRPHATVENALRIILLTSVFTALIPVGVRLWRARKRSH
jgi:hypothetical protein